MTTRAYFSFFTALDLLQFRSIATATTSLFVCILWFSPAQAQVSQWKKNLDKTTSEVKKNTSDLKKTASEAKKTGQSVQETVGGTTTASSPKNSSSATASTDGRHYYIRPDGRGKEATKEAPAKDIAAIAALLKAGDVIHIAAGTYTGKADQSSDVLTVPVSIIGGYSPDFSSRDPWKMYRTVLSGTNDISKGLTTERIGILTDKEFREWKGVITIDGIIIDNGARNYYADATETFIRRKASAENGMNPTPNTPGIKVRTGAGTQVVIKNCVVTNTAPTQGAIDVQVGKNGSALIENNLIVNNTGEGIMCKSNHHGADGHPAYTVRNNTILFTWKYDAIASFGGNSIMFDESLSILIENNVLGCSDMGGRNNIKQCKKVTMKNNLFVGHKKYDYQEFATGLKLDELEDYANFVTSASGGNYSQEIQLKMPQKWAELYFGRKEISRAEVDAAAKVSNSGANQLRAMFGLPLQASSVATDAEVWLHRMGLEDAVQLGFTTYGKNTGCQIP